MNLRNKDESGMPQREESLARRAARLFARTSPAADEAECPDLEMVAAYNERSLDPAEMAGCESHFALCARCRELLRAFAATAGTPLAGKEVSQLERKEVAARSAVAARAPAEQVAPAAPAAPSPAADERPSRGTRWTLRWLVPAFGVAAALALWFAVRPPSSDKSGSSPALVAQAPLNEAPAVPSAAAPSVPEKSKDARADERQAPSGAGAPAQAASNATNGAAPQNSPAQPANEAGSAAVAAAVDKSSPVLLARKEAPATADQKLETKKDAAPMAGAAAQSAPVAPPPSPAAEDAMKAQATLQAEAKTAPAADLSRASQSSTAANSAGATASRDKQADQVSTMEARGAVTGAARGASVPQPAAPAPDRRFTMAERSVLKPPVLLKAPSGVVVWRVGNGGSIERSNDAGKTWAAQKSPSGEEWLTGHALSDAVCWVAGTKGAIARTLDGLNWDRIAPPLAGGTGGPLPDWTSISARDYLTATVASADGRKFFTSNGGTTWQEQ